MVFDRLKAGLAAFVLGVYPRIDYLARYPGRLVKQGGANSFDFQPDSPNVPGVAGVPVRLGLPGATIQLDLSKKPRALLGFSGGDPQAPFVDLWEQPGLSELTMDPLASVNLGPAAAAVGRVGDAVSAASGMTTWMTQVSGYINGIAPGTVSPATPITFGTIAAGSPKVKA